jgi:UDP-N-acetylmuramoyl-tripeptide--D-alanyl-D-alanine ligase
LENCNPLFGRGEVIEGPVSIVKDCYNANPESMEEAIEFMDELPWRGRKIYVIGAMKELGPGEDGAHSALGERLSRSKADAVFFLGEETESAYSIVKKSSHIHTAYYKNHEELVRAVLSSMTRGDVILLKGSRTMELERLIEPIREKGSL